MIAGVVLAALSFPLLSSCDDDHYTVDPVLSGKGTIWENISGNSDLSEFSSILSKVYYSTSESNVTTQTYSDLLNHDQTFTVWAPKNGTFDYAKWNAMLESGEREQIYKVENQLIRSCMTRYSHVLSGNKVEDVTFFNSKNGTFDCGERTINGVNIVDANLGSSNGVVHITDGAVTYLPNVYEYINESSNLSKLNAFLKKYETIEFNERASTQGPTIDGNITWVDSVNTTTNTYFYYLNAYLNHEDSSYVMVMPTDACWDSQYEKMKKYFHYLPSYKQTVTTVNPLDLQTSTEDLTTTYTEEEIDSITDFYTCDAIARNLSFNHNWQFGHNYVEMATDGACDSIRSSNGIVFYDPWGSRLFDNVTPVQLSNGYAYVVDNFNYRMQDTWFDEKTFTYEAEFRYESYDYCSVQRKNVEEHMSYPLYGEESGAQIDTLMKLNYLKLLPTRATANNSVKFELRNTYSCKYDIIAVMVYNFDQNKPYHFRAYLNYHDQKPVQEHVQLTPPEGVEADNKNFVTKGLRYDNDGRIIFTDSVLLAKNFELPVSYFGLRDAYVTLELQSYLTSSQRNNYTNELIIDKIILVPKENEE